MKFVVQAVLVLTLCGALLAMHVSMKDCEDLCRQGLGGDLCDCSTEKPSTEKPITEDICYYLCGAQVGGFACNCSKPSLPGK